MRRRASILIDVLVAIAGGLSAVSIPLAGCCPGREGPSTFSDVGSPATSPHALALREALVIAEGCATCNRIVDTLRVMSAERQKDYWFFIFEGERSAPGGELVLLSCSVRVYDDGRVIFLGWK